MLHAFKEHHRRERGAVVLLRDAYEPPCVGFTERMAGDPFLAVFSKERGSDEWLLMMAPTSAAARRGDSIASTFRMEGSRILPRDEYSGTNTGGAVTAAACPDAPPLPPPSPPDVLSRIPSRLRSTALRLDPPVDAATVVKFHVVATVTAAAWLPVVSLKAFAVQLM
ncbi:MAG: hypothetical protein Greene101449_412 [Candidatus Peregrinibacteria bacterium Greene1014_49]|nr:MAG: hypothetical protein Greene101449_412 [Candidatus Peregrinibacteria bacterium Greene1014_49]